MKREEDEGNFRMILEFRVFKVRRKLDPFYGQWFWRFLRYDKHQANGPFATATEALEDALSNGNLVS